MVQAGTDRSRVVLALVGVTVVALTLLSHRLLGRATTAAGRPLPAADVQALTAFLGPLPDSTRLVEARPGTIVGERDPFDWSTSGIRAPVRSGAAPESSPTTGGSQRWIVSSILFEGSKRSAIVNNAWVNVGDLLGGGARVTAIERKYVVVTDANGNRHVLPIQGGARDN